MTPSDRFQQLEAVAEDIVRAHEQGDVRIVLNGIPMESQP